VAHDWMTAHSDHLHKSPQCMDTIADIFSLYSGGSSDAEDKERLTRTHTPLEIQREGSWNFKQKQVTITEGSTGLTTTSADIPSGPTPLPADRTGLRRGILKNDPGCHQNSQLIFITGFCIIAKPRRSTISFLQR
jgi:hypothetical protein